MTPVSPQELQKHWVFVEAGLKEIIRKTGEKWTPTHIEQAINEKWAFLFVCDEGFAVIQERREEWTSRPYLSVWAMWFEPWAALAKEEEIFAWLDELTARAGYAPWGLGSPRMGWFKRLKHKCVVERISWRRRQNG